MIDIVELEKLFNKQIKLESGIYGKNVSIKELISLAKSGDKVAIKFLEETLIHYEELFNGLEYAINDTIKRQNNKIQKEEEILQKEYEKEMQEYKQIMEETREDDEKRLKRKEETTKTEEKREKEIKKQKKSKQMDNMLIGSKDSIKQEDKEYIKYKNLYFEDIELPSQDLDLEKIVSLSRKGNKEAKDIAGIALFKRTYKIAKQFSYINFGIEFEDLLQEAMIGLNDFITENKYAKKRNNNEVLKYFKYKNKLTDFEASIICAITDGIKYSSQYGISNKDIIDMILYKINSELLLQELGTEPTNDEISQEICKPIESVNYTNKLVEPTISINNISEEELTLRSPDYDISDTNTEEKVMKKIEYEIIFQILEEIKVPERDKEIFMRLYKEELTLEEAGKNYNISRERVRQIEAKALRKIRCLFENPKYKYKVSYVKLPKKITKYRTSNSQWSHTREVTDLQFKNLDLDDMKKRIKANRSYHYYR